MITSIKFITTSFTLRTPFKTLKRNLTKSPRKESPIAASIASNYAELNISLTDEQQKVSTAISKKQPVFITGSAGTGKTFLMNHLINRLKKVHGKGSVFVTASTGVAACALNGVTLHSFAGVGLGDGDKETLLNSVFGNPKVLRKWRRAKALMIDEISMVDGELLEKLEYIARMVRCGVGFSLLLVGIFCSYCR